MFQNKVKAYNAQSSSHSEKVLWIAILYNVWFAFLLFAGTPGISFKDYQTVVPVKVISKNIDAEIVHKGNRITVNPTILVESLEDNKIFEKGSVYRLSVRDYDFDSYKYGDVLHYKQKVLSDFAKLDFTMIFINWLVAVLSGVGILIYLIEGIGKFIYSRLKDVPFEETMFTEYFKTFVFLVTSFLVCSLKLYIVFG